MFNYIEHFQGRNSTINSFAKQKNPPLYNFLHRLPSDSIENAEFLE